MIECLALDLGGKLGVAYFQDKKHHYETVVLDEGIKEARSYLPAVRLTKWLNTLHHRKPIQNIVFEETFCKGAAKMRLDSLQAAVAIFAIAHSIPWTRISASKLKSFSTGNGQCGKDQMIAAAKKYFSIEEEITSDQADALCLLRMWEYNQ